MDNATYIALSFQMPLFRQMAVIANNMANANTTGFKAENMMFESYLEKIGNEQVAGKQKASFVNDIATYQDTKQGSLEATNNPLDVAINGKGYFVIETPQGERFTRAGSFHVNADGQLVNPQNYPVVGDGGAIEFAPEDVNIKIGENGIVTANNGDIRGQLRVAGFENEQMLDQGENGLFSTKADAIAASNFTIAQGMLENSNVNPVLAMTQMIEVQRSAGRVTDMLRNMHDLTLKAISTFTVKA